MPAPPPMMSLRKPQGSSGSRSRTQFWAGRTTQRDLKDIQHMYVDQLKIGRKPSTSLIVRRSLGLLASHLRGVQEQNEIDHETAVLVRHSND